MQRDLAGLLQAAHIRLREPESQKSQRSTGLCWSVGPAHTPRMLLAESCRGRCADLGQKAQGTSNRLAQKVDFLFPLSTAGVNNVHRTIFSKRHQRILRRKSSSSLCVAQGHRACFPLPPTQVSNIFSICRMNIIADLQASAAI